jgi:hypothetical protein
MSLNPCLQLCLGTPEDLKSQLFFKRKNQKTALFPKSPKMRKTVNFRATSSKVTLGGSPIFLDPLQSVAIIDGRPLWVCLALSGSRVFR